MSRWPGQVLPPSVLLAVLLCLSVTTRAAAPHRSFSSLSFGNGFGAAIYDSSQSRVTTLTDHLYAYRSATESTVDLCYDTYFGLREGGANLWLGEAPATAGYVPQTAVIKVSQSHGTLTAEQYFFSPWGLAHPALVMVARVTTSAASTTNAALFTLHNFHLGKGASGSENEQITYLPATHTFLERGTTTGRILLQHSLTAPDKHGASPQNPYALVKAGGTLTDVEDSGVMDDAVSGFQYDLVLTAGQEAWFGVVLVAGADENKLVQDLAAYLAGRSAQQLVTDEIQAWQSWHQQDVEPVGLSTDERTVYQQALTILRLGQCREPNESSAGGAKPYGQLVASLPPGQWNISWVRDAAYAITALTQAGHLTEARDALTFMLNGQAGQYICCDSQSQPYVGLPYAISVTRYYGNGTEESDSNTDGPNIEFDNFGLFLWAAAQVVAALPAQEATAFLSTWYGTMRQGVAEVLLSLVEPATGLLRADSSIWERHWENGKRRHFAYSNIMAVAGLHAAAQLATLHGQSSDASTYKAAALQLAQAIAAKLVDPASDVLVADLESLPLGLTGYLDGAVVEALLHDILHPLSSTGTATLNAFQQYLGLPTGPGFKRNDDGDTYDEREWLIIDLRVAAARFRRGETAAGQAILDWITQMALKNDALIPELLDQSSADYAGEIPMVGFGAGAYVLSLFHRAAGSVPAPDGGIPLADSVGPRDGGSPRDAALAETTSPPGDGGPADAPLHDGKTRDSRITGEKRAPTNEGCACSLGASLASPSGAWLCLALFALWFARYRGGR